MGIQERYYAIISLKVEGDVLQIRLPKRMKDDFTKLCKREGTTATAVLQRLIIVYIARKGRKWLDGKSGKTWYDLVRDFDASYLDDDRN